MSFSASFPDNLLMDTLGDSVTITLGGVPVTLKAIIETDVYSTDSMSETQTEIEILTESLPIAPASGDAVQVNGQRFALKTRLNQDTHYQRWSLVHV